MVAMWWPCGTAAMSPVTIYLLKFLGTKEEVSTEWLRPHPSDGQKENATHPNTRGVPCSRTRLEASLAPTELCRGPEDSTYLILSCDFVHET